MIQELEDENVEDSRIDDFLDSLKSFSEEEDIKELKIDTQKIENDTFTIETKEQANFFIQQVLDARKQIDDIQQTANDMLLREQAKINRWMEKETSKIQSSVDYISGLLQNFAEKELEESKSKKKSISLPNGSIGFRKLQPKYEYDDETILPYLQNNNLNEFIRLKPTVNHTDLKKSGDVISGKLVVNNEEIPGVIVIPQDPKFEIKE